MSIAYGDVRLMPDSAPAKELEKGDANEDESERDKAHNIGTLMETAIGVLDKDVGKDNDDAGTPHTGDLKRDEYRVLQVIKDTVGDRSGHTTAYEGNPVGNHAAIATGGERQNLERSVSNSPGGRSFETEKNHIFKRRVQTEV